MRILLKIVYGNKVAFKNGSTKYNICGLSFDMYTCNKIILGLYRVNVVVYSYTEMSLFYVDFTLVPYSNLCQLVMSEISSLQFYSNADLLALYYIIGSYVHLH